MLKTFAVAVFDFKGITIYPTMYTTVTFLSMSTMSPKSILSILPDILPPKGTKPETMKLPLEQELVMSALSSSLDFGLRYHAVIGNKFNFIIIHFIST